MKIPNLLQSRINLKYKQFSKMKKLSNALIIAMLILNSCADGSFLNPSEISNVILPSNGATEYHLEVSIRKAPIAPDGTTAKAQTDIVLTFVDIDPDVKGIDLVEGATVQVKLPDEFVNIEGDVFMGNSIILLQGWPQSPPAPPPAFPWTTTVDGNTITATLTGDFLQGILPGPKQAHLLLPGFENPKPGKYEIPIRIKLGPSTTSDIMSGIGDVIIIPKSRPSIHAISLFSGPPGPPPPFFNPIYQEVVQGESAVRVGMYLWDKDNEAFLGVDLQMVKPSHYLLVQNGSTVGQVRIDAPPGANNYSLTTNTLTPPGEPPDLSPSPSVEVPAFITGLPTGLRLVQFTPDVAGNYTLSFRLNNGNTQDLFVTAVTVLPSI